MDRALYTRNPNEPRPTKRSRADPCLSLKQRLVGLKPDTVISQLDLLVAEVKRNDGEFVLISTLLSCVEAFPTMTSTYALLVGALTGMREDDNMQTLGLRVVLEAARRIKTGVWRAERMLVKFLAACFKACGISMGMLFQLVLEPLVSGALGGSVGQECTREDEIRLLAVLGCVPWLACSQQASRADAEEDAHCESWLNEVSSKLVTLLRPRALLAQYAALPRAQQDRLDPDCDRIALAVALATSLEPKLDLDFDYLLIASAQNLPGFGDLKRTHMDLYADLDQEMSQIPGRLSASSGMVANTLEHFTHLPLFKNGQQPVWDTAAELEEVRKPSLMERFRVRENVLDVLGSYFPKSSEAADALLLLNSPYQAVEGCLSQMLAMPTPEHSILFYGEVLIHMCLKSPETIPAAMEDALDQILELEPDNLDSDALDRLALWFANHVLTFDLDWPWIKWRTVYELAETRSVRALVDTAFQRIALVRTVNQSLLDEVEMPKELGDRLLQFVRPTVATGEEDFSQSAYLPTPAGEQLVAQLRARPSTGELVDFITRLDTLEWGTVSGTKLLVHSALFLGKASLSQTRSALEHVGPALQSLSQMMGSDGAESRIVAESAFQAVVEFWQANLAMEKWAVFALGCLLDVGVGNCTLALSWLAKDHTLTPYFKRRAMEDVLARVGSDDEKRQALQQAAAGDLDEDTDLWLARRGI
ncbi:hypothetical protein BASA81_002000 [Batrachochytrium salamandrivorans]|nr:hypothetical protein BASA81_002000 [Batrachochytrium salamandrivorans]